MKRIMYLLFALLLPLAFSSCQETPTEQAVVLQNITCVDNDNNLITEITYAINQVEYIYENVKVYANYSDGSSGEVTAFSTFTQIDLSTTGIKTVTVSYKECKYEFNVNVIEINLKRIELNTTNVRKVYRINEILDLTNIEVFVVYENNNQLYVKDFGYSVYDSNNKLLNDNKFVKVGIHKVEIKYKNKIDSFEVYVYGDDYNYCVNLDEKDTNDLNQYNFEANEYIYQEEDFFITSEGNVIADYNDTFNFIGFNTNCSLIIKHDSGLNLSIRTNFKAIIVIEGTYYDSLTITSYDRGVVNYFYDIVEGNTVIYFEGINDLYKIQSNLETKILSVILSVNEVIKLQGIELDLTNVKTKFSYSESFSYEGLIVYGLLNQTEKRVLNPNEFEVKLEKNNNYVDDFIGSGTYNVIINYLEDPYYSKTYIIYVENKNINYVSLKLDTTNVKTNFEKNETFNYDNLIIYGINSLNEEILIENYRCEIKLIFTNGSTSMEVDGFQDIPGVYSVEVSYFTVTNTISNYYNVSYDLGVIEYDGTPTTEITNLENGRVKIVVDKVLDTISSARFEISSNGSLITNVNTLSSIISNLDSNRIYTLSGYYIGELNGQEYIVYIEEKIFQLD